MPNNATHRRVAVVARLAIDVTLPGAAAVLLSACASSAHAKPIVAAQPAAAYQWATASRSATLSKPAAPPKPLSPFSDSPVSFLVRGQFARGELVIVRVCLRADHSVASSQVLESSGDWRFDQLAVQWAQRVRLRAPPTDGTPLAQCGAVRVELHNAPEPQVIPGPEGLLG